MAEPSPRPGGRAGRPTREQNREVPKVLLHDHLDGGLRAATIAELARASGFLFILVPPMLLLFGVAADLPALAFVALFGVAPLLRLVYGDDSANAPQWHESVATVLEWLPIFYAVIFVGCLGSVLVMLHAFPPVRFQWLWLGLSVWAVFVFASCVAHELLHRRSTGSRIVGRLLAGVIAVPTYPPDPRDLASGRRRIRRIAADAGATMALTTAGVCARLDPAAGGEAQHGGLHRRVAPAVAALRELGDPLPGVVFDHVLGTRTAERRAGVQ